MSTFQKKQEFFEQDSELEDYEDSEILENDFELDLESDELDMSPQDLEAEEEIGQRSRAPLHPLRTRPLPLRPLRPRPQPPARRPPAYRPKPPRAIRRHPRSVSVGEPVTCICPEKTCPEHGTEYIRWVQSALNDVLGLRLPVNGIMGPETRSAVRSFQQREGLPVTGIVGPDIESALIAARGGKSPGAGATKPAEPGMPEQAEPAATALEPDSATPAAEFQFEWEDETNRSRETPFKYVKDFSRPASECAAALQRAGKTRAEALALAEPGRVAHRGIPHGLPEPDRRRPGQGERLPRSAGLTMLERCRMEPETALLEVIPPDTRRRVSEADTTGLPHRWICYLREPNADPSVRSYGMGTGVLVGPRHVLTSAHVLVSEKDPSKTVGSRLRVQPARNGDHQPFPEVKVRGWRVDPRWIRKVGAHWRVQARFDYGLVVLEKDVSGWKHPGLGECSLAYWGAPDICFPQTEVGLAADKVAGQDAWSAGYPGDREPGTMHGGAGQITYDNHRGVLMHTIDTYGGQSGAPIWIKRHGMWCLVGIHSRGGRWAVVGGRAVPTHNAAVLVSFDVLRQVEEWKRSFRA
jgi:V8-like Glu-specific endopeptidase